MDSPSFLLLLLLLLLLRPRLDRPAIGAGVVRSFGYFFVRTMKPSVAQRIFASHWLVRGWFAATSLAAVAVCVRVAGIGGESLRDGSAMALGLGIVALAAGLGLALGAVVGVFVLGPIYHARGIANGGPFRPGDLVQVIGGRYRGTVTRVREEWQGGSVRIELGQDAEAAYKDVFTSAELLRVAPDPPQGTPKAGSAAPDGVGDAGVDRGLA